MHWLLTRGRFPFLALLLAATAFLALHAAQLGVETNNESLSASNPERDAIYDRFRATFGSDEDLLLAVVHPLLLETAGLRFIADLHGRIARIDGVRGVYDLTNAQQLVSGDGGAELAPLLPNPPSDSAMLRATLDRNPDLTGLFVSRDRRSAGVLIEIEDRPSDRHYRAAIIDALRALVATESRDGIALHLTGIAVQKHDVSAFIERDQRWLVPLAVVVLGFVLAAFFRSVLGVLLPLAVTGVTVAWTLGAYQLAGLELNAITSLLPPVLMVLSLAVSVHVIQVWIDSAATGDRVTRLLHVVRDVRFACFFCSLTTALGLASLLTSNMPAVRYFGAFAALGVLVSFAVGITLVPVGLSFLEVPASAQRSAQHRGMRRVLAWSARIATQAPLRVPALFAAITALSIAALPRLANNTDLVRFLKSDAPLHRDTLFIDQHLTGASALDFVVSRRDDAALTSKDDIARLANFERSILAHEEVTGATSILAVLRQLQRAESGGEALVLPPDERSTAYAFDLLEATPEQPLLRKVIAGDFTTARVNVRIHSVGTAIAAPLAETILAEGRTHFGDAYRVEATGSFYRVAHDSNQLVASQLRSFGLALAMVVAVIGALFRSIRLTAIAMVPNVMPILWTGGLMAVLGIDLSTGTAMIASAVIGIVVDDTIHYLTDYRRNYRGDARDAVRRTTNGVGVPLLINNVALVLGFWVGCFGSFKPTIYFSLLTGLTMITALVCDLFVTPALLVLSDRPRASVA